MTSMESNEVLDILRRTDPELKRIVELDISQQDKSEDGVMLDFAALVTYILVLAIGGNGKFAYSLIQGLRCTMYVIKNDHFIIGANNPSGNDKTVYINDVINALNHRYFYYRMKYGEQLPNDLLKSLVDFQRNLFTWDLRLNDQILTHLSFKVHCSVVTYGDDSLLSVSAECHFYDPVAIPALGLENGFVYTDGSKSHNIEWRCLNEVQFLKRQFVFREDLQCFVARLSMKTIVKMMVIRKKSTLGARDHCCELATNVLREMAYYPKEDFDAIRSKYLEVLAKYGLLNNAYFRDMEYEACAEDMRAGRFSTWKQLTIENEHE